MTSFSKFVVISFVLHLILFLALVDITISGKVLPSAGGVYEVSIVSEKDISKTGKLRASPKRVYRARPKRATGLKGVGKELALKEKAPDLSPKEIAPPAKKEPDTEYGESPNIIRHPARDGGARVSGNNVAFYEARIKEIIKGHWRVPPEIVVLKSSLKATYMMRIVRNGDVVDKKLIVSSGNKPFDRSILRALNNVKKLPVPPLVLIAGANTLEIVITFSSEELIK